MSNMTVIIKMAVSEQEVLRDLIDKYSNQNSQIEKNGVFRDIKKYIDILMETSFYDGLECRMEKSLEKPKEEKNIVVDKNVLLMKPEKEKEDE